MAIDLQIRNGLLEAVCHGKLTRKDLELTRTALCELEARLEVTPDRISDLTVADVSDLRAKDMVVFAEYRRGVKLKNKIKSAIITPKGSVQHGLARMFIAYNQNPDIEIMIFHDSASCFCWLGREAGAVKPPNT